MRYVKWSFWTLVSALLIAFLHYTLPQHDIVRIVGNIKKPTWTSELEGSGEGLRWSQGNTNFVEGLVFPLNVGLQRRNSHAAATNLTA